MKLYHNSMIFLTALSLLGCRSDKSHDESQRQADLRSREWQVERPAPATATVSRHALPVAIEPTLVLRGRPPLVYMLESSCTVTVTDLTSSTRLARRTVDGPTIVRIEPRKGIFFGTELLTRGPLAGEHEYGIYLETDQPNVIESETIGPSTAPVEGTLEQK